ncbi:hypothetical protein SteCoe_13271 [Stentor coeruleus]|uniref:MORN repeat protein n=1 Tax=Stentor coeruleus TaxID=5963 RepID=A0A1R2C8T5_9CILI|nr:hypothetical protein SteCoe_13271 [Stentor coeruleus]
MGNCSCLHGIHEEKQIDTEKLTNPPEIVLKKSIDSNSKKLSECYAPERYSEIESNQNLPIFKGNLNDIIKLQSTIRGYLDRRKVKSMNISDKPIAFLNDLNDRFNIKNFEDIENKDQARQELIEIPIHILPDYSSSMIKSIRIKLGDFIYSNNDNLKIDGIIRRGPVMIENGAIFSGEWNGQKERHGKGTHIWKDGSLYEGYWENDKANGRGRLIHSNGDVYEGEWVNDKAHGHGIYIHSDGAKYEGTWENDKQHGQGSETWPDGAKYQGQYINGQKHGFGKFEWADGSIYEGEFRENNIHGTGTYVWSDGRKFVGDWKDNKMDGKGLFTWSDGRSYEGEYIDDKKQGFGIFIWPDGRRYEGYWLNGKQEGRGTYVTPQGSREGEWKDGRRIKNY